MSVDREAVDALADAWDREPDTTWQPAGLPQFKKGDRVRIRLSAECRLTGPKDSPAGDLGLVGHHGEEDGRSGVVVDSWIPNPHVDAQGHPYRVRRDGPLIDGYRAGLYAASELILLDVSPETDQ